MTHSNDTFEHRLRSMLVDATVGLEPTRSPADGDVAEFATVRTRRQVGSIDPSRSWARAAAVGLTAAAAIATILWATTDRDQGSPAVVPSVAPTDPSSRAADRGDPQASTSAGVATSVVGTEQPVPAFDPINVLVVGLDRTVGCFDPSSPFAAAYSPDDIGARGDTIMMLRLDPASETASVLSFPRDLWLPTAGTDGKSRLSAAVVADDPTRLIGTLYDNFGISPDHFVQLDYCGFATLVDAIGGVDIPFDASVRDTHTGLHVATPGCVTLNGAEALAYVRSRYLEYFDDDGTWQRDPTSDLGRMSRQQDFLVRVLRKWSDDGIPGVEATRSLISVMQDDLVVDQELTIRRILDIADFLTSIDPGSVQTYTIEATSATVANQVVLVPQLDGDHMRAVLALFRGEAASTATTETPAVDSSVGDISPIPDATPIGVVPVSDAAC